jgi:flagellar basal-body rod protein FlgC
LNVNIVTSFHPGHELKADALNQHPVETEEFPYPQDPPSPWHDDCTSLGRPLSGGLKPVGGKMKRTSLWLVALMFLFAALQRQGFAFSSGSEKYYTMLESQVRDTAFVKFLRDRGVKLETDANGLMRIYVQGAPETIPAVVKFLGLMKARMEVVTNNLANFNTTHDTGGKGPYRRKKFTIDKDGNASVVIDESPPRSIYIPGHPDADKQGLVSFPNISPMMEIVEMYDVLREYNLAVSLLEQCLPGNYVPDPSIQMMRWNAEHFREIDENRDRLDRIERKLDTLKPAG